MEEAAHLGGLAEHVLGIAQLPDKRGLVPLSSQLADVAVGREGFGGISKCIVKLTAYDLPDSRRAPNIAAASRLQDLLHRQALHIADMPPALRGRSDGGHRDQHANGVNQKAI